MRVDGMPVIYMALLEKLVKWTPEDAEQTMKELDDLHTEMSETYERLYDLTFGQGGRVVRMLNDNFDRERETGEREGVPH
ncbi:hypothetical protein KIPB_002141 [Kipferlia bialata]|uniref:Uncharacterized protein n=1 Tax=Kipferlia bialata TaxID=797122 RepID=A0A391NUB3_9EUKA|nr:hypothetical protein KIPB_002141 [Kipferlia bialata]|eukprot:g2141.t1